MNESTASLYKELVELGIYTHATEQWHTGDCQYTTHVNKVDKCLTIHVAAATVGVMTHSNPFAIVHEGAVVKFVTEGGYVDTELDRVLTSLKEALLKQPSTKTEA